ncbi:MAG: hypothetical protein AB1507_05890 [Bacillota bacterium]|jgi:hypothetical protein
MIPDLEKREVTVKPLPPLKLHLVEVADGMKVESEKEGDKRANVIFKSEKMQDIITVNLTTGKVEAAVTTGATGKIQERPESEYPHPIKPNRVETLPSGEGKIELYEGSKPSESLTANEKEIFAQMLKDIGEKDQRIKDLLKDNDYEILDIVRSKPATTKTERGYTTRVETVTVVLEKESTGEKHRITIDLASNTVKSIEKE